MRIAIAARANARVVSIAQNIGLGGIHFGTRAAVSRRKSAWLTANEIAQTPSPMRASRPNAAALFPLASVVAKRAIEAHSMENIWKKLPPNRSKRFVAAMMPGMQASEKHK